MKNKGSMIEILKKRKSKLETTRHDSHKENSWEEDEAQCTSLISLYNIIQRIAYKEHERNTIMKFPFPG
ncbi:MAG TPA: hypothetical protein PK048_00915 [Candidatus Absconditabacterales bacterium]|nr:hypothetical protein [Candidatus Absconditabacterales bacterium]